MDEHGQVKMESNLEGDHSDHPDKEIYKISDAQLVAECRVHV